MRRAVRRVALDAIVLRFFIDSNLMSSEGGFGICATDLQLYSLQTQLRQICDVLASAYDLYLAAR